MTATKVLGIPGNEVAVHRVADGPGRASPAPSDARADRLVRSAAPHVVRSLAIYRCPADAAVVVTEARRKISVAFERIGPLLERLEKAGDVESAKHIRTAAERGTLPLLVVLMSGATRIFGADREGLLALKLGGRT